MPWTDNQFRAHWSREPEKAEAMIAARQVMAECTSAMATGLIRFWHPTPGIPLDPEYIDRVMERMDIRWNIEWQSRGSRYKNSQPPRFRERLTYAQQACFVQKLRAALGKDPLQLA